MEAVILDGAVDEDPTLALVSSLLTAEIAARGGTTETFPLRTAKIAYCAGCFECWTKTPGVCIVDDAGREVARAVIRSDLVVFLTPITFGGYSSELKKVLERLLGLLAPWFMKIDGVVHHQRRYERFPRLLGVGVLERPDAEWEAAFHTLVQRNSLNLHSPAQTSGVLYRTQQETELRDRIRDLLDAVEVA